MFGQDNNRPPSLPPQLGSAFMEPCESLRDELPSINDIKGEVAYESIPICSPSVGEHRNSKTDFSLKFMDENENLTIATPQKFCDQLRINDDDKIKVVSIFGNTGDGKSHTLNHLFYGGKEIFKTSSEQNSCTLGVYAAVQRKMHVLCLDTEGLLGATVKSQRRMRMLLKILAISDIVIYRTRSERLHTDMYEFLATASKAFSSHFKQALESLTLPGSAKTLGPAVIIFHETRHTKPLQNTVNGRPEDKLRENFDRLKLEIDAFSSLQYVGIKTDDRMETDFSSLESAVKLLLDNASVRSPRQPSVIFKILEALNRKFSGEIVQSNLDTFPEQYFTCPLQCEACGRRCQRSMGHLHDKEEHFNQKPCNYQHQYENKIYLCKRCHDGGREIKVNIKMQSQSDNTWLGLAKFAWSGAVIDCPYCGEIYRERQYWYGNKPPEDTAVRTEIIHVWKDSDFFSKTQAHSAQNVLDTVTYLSETISSISAQPTKAVSEWIADKVAPSYWRPNNEITLCNNCKKSFEKTGLLKHHCRGCGEGYCEACSKHKMPVPARGWADPVRVCNHCRDQLKKNPNALPAANNNAAGLTDNSNNNNCTGKAAATDESDVRVRKIYEPIIGTVVTVTKAFEIPKELIKDSARPTYWVPDSEAPNCNICKLPFGTIEELQKNLQDLDNLNKTKAKPNGYKNTEGASDFRRHHCRRCGQAVCASCSLSRCPVPERNWLTDVRVCDACVVDTKTDAEKSKND